MKCMKPILDEARAILEKCGIPYNRHIEFKYSGRMTRALGKTTHYNRDGHYAITLSKQILDDTFPHDGTLNVVLHELIHTCEGCMNHGNLWKSYGDRVFLETGMKINRLADAETTAEYLKRTVKPAKRYCVECTNCGYRVYRTRMCGLIENPSDYTHTTCRGHFRRVLG